MRNLFATLRKVQAIIDTGVVWVTGTMLYAITCLTCLQVFFRYVLRNSLSWSEELTRYMLVWIVFLAAGYVLSRGAHANLDMIINKLPQSIRMAVQRGTALLLIVFSGLLIRYGIVLMSFGSRQKSSALQIPMSWVYIVIPIGGALLAFYSFMLLEGKKEDGA